jgi:uncharacterized protein YqiB (DUF1249 family)
VADPGVTVKVYHDARQAEALACMKTGFMSVEHSHTNQKPYVDCRWESNMFIGKWLSFSLQQGHIFTVENRQADNTEDQSPQLENV